MNKNNRHNDAAWFPLSFGEGRGEADRIIFLLFLFFFLCCFYGCSDIDNYPAPDSAFYGKVVTASGDLVQQRVQASTGLKFNLYETKKENSLPQQFYAKPDGTFENAMLFGGEYRVTLEQANFYPIDEVVIMLNGRTEHTYTVVPFCEVKNVTVQHVSGKKVKVRFSLSREKDEDCKIINYTVYGHVSPYVDDLSVNHRISTSVTMPESDEVLPASDKVFETEIDMDDDREFDQRYAHIVKANKNQIYIRVGIMTAFPYSGEPGNPGTTYMNFSEVIPVAITLN